MKNYIKCTNCGGTDFVRAELESTDIFEVGIVRIMGINAYACKRCGHLELFQASMDAYAKELKDIAKEEKQKQKEEKKRKIEEIKDKIIKTQAIIDDMNSTQRQVLDAKEQLAKLKKEYMDVAGIPYAVGNFVGK